MHPVGEYAEFLISEKYISSHALPNEQIDLWLKWNEKAKYDRIILRASREFRVQHFLNVAENVFQNNQIISNEFIVKKQWLQVNGFFGFISFIDHMPNRDEKLEFTILFEENEKVVWTEKFVSKIIVPHMECKNVATDEIRITRTRTEISLRLELLISGTASVKDVRPISRIVKKRKNIELTVVADNSEQPEIALSPPFVNYKLVIKGTGFALVKLVSNMRISTVTSTPQK